MAKYPVDFLLSLDDWQLMSLDKLISAHPEQFFRCCEYQISSKAGHVTNKRLYDHDDNATLSEVKVLKCPGCNKTVAVWIQHKWWAVDEILKSIHCTRDGFMQVKTPGEFLVLWCLNSVIFEEYDNDNANIEFLSIFPGEFGKIYWNRGVAVGFYTLKRKDMRYNENQMDTYCMPVIDLIFVRKTHRRSGIGFKVLQDVLDTYSDQDIGLSYPISDSMFKVLHKFLKTRRDLRSLTWETQWIGCEGYRKNVWYTLCKLMKNNSKSKMINNFQTYNPTKCMV